MRPYSRNQHRTTASGTANKPYSQIRYGNDHYNGHHYYGGHDWYFATLDAEAENLHDTLSAPEKNEQMHLLATF